jgi:hypothetical protein
MSDFENFLLRRVEAIFSCCLMFLFCSTRGVHVLAAIVVFTVCFYVIAKD